LRRRAGKRIVLAWVFAAVAAAGCRAQTAPPQRSAIDAFAPSTARTLRSFGAAGDDRRDDTAAIGRALSHSSEFCLDGEGRSYRVSGTLEVKKDICLRNATLVQSLPPFDTSAYIVAKCPVTPDPDAVIDCGDPVVPAEQLSRLRQSLAVRTLLIRPADPKDRIRVNFDHVKVDRGRYPEGGSRTDSAGIWIQDAERVDLNSVEITGYGKGHGLFVNRSDRVNVNNLWIHDLVWAPYPGDAPLTVSRVSKIGWNTVPIHEFRAAGRDGVKVSKFYGVRIQEQVTCALFSDVHHVQIRNARISRCMARFDSGDLPWQADGLDISRSSSDVRVDGATIDSTWEAMDVVANGNGVTDLVISNVAATNSFAFGLKLGKHLRRARLSDVRVSKAGIAGVVVYGPVTDLSISGAKVSDVGWIVGSDGKSFAPWPAGNRAGFRIDGHAGGPSAGVPRNIEIDDATVTGGAVARGYEFGILNTGGTGIQVRNFRATGFSKRRTFGVDPH
jgi:hypothetical protein